MKKLLLTGFDPFAHYNINPSWEAVKALPEVIGSFSVHKMLPNIYGTAGRLLLEEAERLKPDVILMTGMDSGSTRLHLDAVAVNLRDALLEDNKGSAPWGEPVVPGAPAAYFTNARPCKTPAKAGLSGSHWLLHRRLCLQRHFLHRTAPL